MFRLAAEELATEPTEEGCTYSSASEKAAYIVPSPTIESRVFCGLEGNTIPGCRKISPSCNQPKRRINNQIRYVQLKTPIA